MTMTRTCELRLGDPFSYSVLAAYSNLLATGWDVVTVSQLLGHANPQITLTICAHALPKPRHGAADALARLMCENPLPPSDSQSPPSLQAA